MKLFILFALLGLIAAAVAGPTPDSKTDSDDFDDFFGDDPDLDFAEPNGEWVPYINLQQ